MSGWPSRSSFICSTYVSISCLNVFRGIPNFFRQQSPSLIKGIFIFNQWCDDDFASQILRGPTFTKTCNAFFWYFDEPTNVKKINKVLPFFRSGRFITSVIYIYVSHVHDVIVLYIGKIVCCVFWMNRESKSDSQIV
jgi:hypothetical protein